MLWMLMSTISEPGDTLATTITAALYNLFKNPDSLKELEDKLSLAGLPENPRVLASKQATVPQRRHQCMMIFLATAFPMDRSIPQGGAMIAGMFFPERTTVGCLPSAVHHRVENFGEDANGHRPERWLTPNRE
ncbi:hypothetical protein GGS26DRAFT_64728 [Hypomontagnella submonticulosa]|nr:hypothetical protein GGS26DRAFT_64728 [Hypomontagnella submonticulosa]